MKDQIQLLKISNRYNRSDRSLLLLQLLAWRKLEQKGEFMLDIPFSELPLEDVSIFKIYRFLDELSGKNTAFRIDERTLEGLSGTELTEIINAVCDFDFTQLNYEFINRLIGTAISKRLGEIYLPLQVAELITGFARIKKNESVICLFENSEWLAFLAAEFTDSVTIYLSEDHPLPHLLNILLDKNVRILHRETPEEVFQNGFDVILDAPSFNDPDVVHRVTYVVEKDFRRAVILVPNSFLFRTTTDAYWLKQEMVDHKMIETVVSLPGGLLAGPTISFLILNLEQSQEEILFVDAGGFAPRSSALKVNNTIHRLPPPTEELINTVSSRQTGENAVLVGLDQTRANDYNLLPERYLLNVRESSITEFLKKTETVPLEELVEFTRPQTIREFEMPESGEEFYEVSVSDIGADGFVQIPPAKKVYLNPNFKSRFENLLLRSSDILLPIKGTVGKVGLIRDGITERLTANQSLIILRLKENSPLINSVVLYRYLSSEIGQTLLQSYVSGAAIPFIQMRDVRQLKVPVLPEEKQKRILDYHAEITGKIAEIENIKKEIVKLRMSIDQTLIS